MMLYISGPITGNPNYLAQFADAELQLSMLGHDVYNPAALGLTDAALTLPAAPGWERTPTWSEYMRRDILVIARDADGLALLPGWQNSEGATLEVQVAKAFGIPIRTIPGWIAHDEENTIYVDIPLDASGFLAAVQNHGTADRPPADLPPLGFFPGELPIEPDADDGWADVDEAKQDPDSPLQLRDDLPEPVAITEAEYLGNTAVTQDDAGETFAERMARKSREAWEAKYGNDGLGNPAGSPADHTTYSGCKHRWVSSGTRDGIVSECPDCGETRIERNPD